MFTQRYFLSTWLLANLVHPVLYVLWFRVQGEDFDWGAGLGAMVMGFFFSLPSLGTCYFLFKPFMQLPIKRSIKFALWQAIVLLTIPVTLTLIFSLMGQPLLWLEAYELLVPGLTAAAFALLLTRQQFVYLLTKMTAHAQ